MVKKTKSGWPSSKVKEEETMKSRWLERIEITIPIIEMIDEKFFGATQFLTPKSVVFGSVVSATILGQPFSGDLDVAVSTQEHSQIHHNMVNSPKWSQNKNSLMNGLAYRNSNLSARVRAISNYVSFGGKKIQIITSTSSLDDPFEDALEVVRGVDFSCCALATDIHGNIFEVIKNAYDDCLGKKLRIIREKGELSYQSLKKRIDKYISRGFTPVEDYSSLLLELERTAPKEEVRRRLDASEIKQELKTFFHLKKWHDNRLVFSLDQMIYTRFPNASGGEFMDTIYDALYNKYRAYSQICREEEIDPEINSNDDENGNICFVFDPYDGGMDWGHFEMDVIKSIADNDRFFQP